MEAVLDDLEVPSTARVRRETAGDLASARLWEATAELAVVSPKARGAATGGALPDTASARKRAKSAGISSLVWHARTKAKSASASASRVRRGPASFFDLTSLEQGTGLYWARQTQASSVTIIVGPSTL